MESYRPDGKGGGQRPSNREAAVTVARHATGKAHPAETEISAAYGGSRAVDAVSSSTGSGSSSGSIPKD